MKNLFFSAIAVLLMFTQCNDIEEPQEQDQEQPQRLTVEINTYPKHFDGFSYSADRTEIYEYNESGKLTRHKKYSEYGITETMYYYEDGILSERVVDHLTFKVKYYYHYNSNKQLSSMEAYQESGLDATFFYEYNNNNLLTKEIEIHADGDTSRVKEYYKDEAGNDTLICKIYRNTRLSKLKYTYDANNNILTEDFIDDGDTSRLAKYTYQYDNKNRIAIMTDQYKNRINSYEYTYLENDSIDFIIEKEGYEGDILQPKHKIEYSYTYE
jgi:hypothetical protein